MRRRLIIIVAASAAAGYLMLGTGSAATFVAQQEAEDGDLSGNAVTISGTAANGASGDGAVRFQAPVSPPPAAPWTLQWQSDPARGLNNFEGVEDDRRDSHPGVTHIFALDTDFRFEMHVDDRDGPDRQRSEIYGIRRPDNSVVMMRRGETWRQIYDVFIPPTFTGTTNFTHINQIKFISLTDNRDMGTPGSPIATLTLVKKGDGSEVMRTVTHYPTPVAFNDIPLSTLRGKWIQVEMEYKYELAANGGYIRMAIRDGATTVTDRTKTDVDIWVEAGTGTNKFMRPKWGIYRSVESAGLQDTYMLMRNMRWYQKQ